MATRTSSTTPNRPYYPYHLYNKARGIRIDPTLDPAMASDSIDPADGLEASATFPEAPAESAQRAGSPGIEHEEERGQGEGEGSDPLPSREQEAEVDSGPSIPARPSPQGGGAGGAGGTPRPKPIVVGEGGGGSGGPGAAGPAEPTKGLCFDMNGHGVRAEGGHWDDHPVPSSG